LPFFESRIQQCVRDFFCPIPKGILGIVTFAITKKKGTQRVPFF